MMTEFLSFLGKISNLFNQRVEDEFHVALIDGGSLLIARHPTEEFLVLGVGLQIITLIIYLVVPDYLDNFVLLGQNLLDDLSVFAVLVFQFLHVELEQVQGGGA